MSMVTSCPACATTFRVTPEQLKKRAGRVRCGKCSDVFDAFKSLATLPDDAAAGGLERARGVEAAAPSLVQTAPAAANEGQGRLDIGEPASGFELSAPAPVVPPPGSRRLLWGSFSVVLVVVLLLQLVHAFRDQLAAAWPASRPLLEQGCVALGCKVGLPRHIEQLAIESSDLQTDAARPGVVVLTAALRNRGNALAAHPALELTLTNAQDQPVARKVFRPTDYLIDPNGAGRGMAGLAELEVRLALDTGDLKPAGYRLLLFYP